MDRRLNWGYRPGRMFYLSVGCLALGFILASFLQGGNAQPSPAPSLVVKPQPVQSEAGARDSAARIMAAVSQTVLLSPAERSAALSRVVTASRLRQEQDRLDQLSPLVTNLLELPPNKDNRAVAYYYVAVLDSRVVAYTPGEAKVAILSSATVGRKDGVKSLDVRGLNLVHLKWSDGAWQYYGSQSLAEPQILTSAENAASQGNTLGSLVRQFEGVANDELG